MISLLKRIEEEKIIDLLSNPHIWNAGVITNPDCKVESIWCPVEIDGSIYKIHIHFNHPSKSIQEYHKHSNSLAIHVLDGIYEVGFGCEVRSPYPDLFNFISNIAKVECYGGMYYEMCDVMNGQHYVKAIGSVCKSIILTSSSNKDEYKNGIVIDVDRVEEIRNWALNFYIKIQLTE